MNDIDALYERAAATPSRRKPIRGATPTPADDTKPTIEMQAGHITRNATEAEAALIAADMPIYQRGNNLVRPVVTEVPASRGRTTQSAGLGILTTTALVDLLCQAATFKKFDARMRAFKRIDPPKPIAETVLSRHGEWSFPAIAGVITTPTIRHDGSIVTEPGFDPTTRLYHSADPNLTLTLTLTRAAADAAMATLQQLLAGFPFVTPTDHAVALSGILSPLCRGACPVVPMHAFRASTAGTGKTFLVDVASAIATARPAPVATVAKTEEETEKRLSALLLGGFPIICLDNVNGELGGDLLCQAVERQIIQIRNFGTLTTIEVESRASIFATGNALRVRGDMTRRTLVADLDAAMERPELRTFDFDPVQDILADRSRYVSAALTIVAAHAAAGFPGCENLRPIASFEAWSQFVRAALIWLGCADPCASMEAARADDPELNDTIELIDAWEAEIGDISAPTSAEILRMIAERTDDHPDSDWKYPTLRAIVVRVAGGKTGLDPRRFGNFLAGKQGKIARGRRIVKAGGAGGGLVRYRFSRV